MAETTVTTIPPGTLIYPSDPNYPNELISGWASGDEHAGHDLNMEYEPVMSPLYLEQFYKYYSTNGHRLYKKDPDKMFDYSQIANDTVVINEGEDVYTVYSINGGIFNKFVNNGTEGWSIVYSDSNLFYSISENSEEYLFCKKEGEDFYYGVTFDDGKYKRVDKIILEITVNSDKISGLALSTIQDGKIVDCMKFTNSDINYTLVDFVSEKKCSLSEMPGFLDLESQVWVKIKQPDDSVIVRRTYYDTTNHCYVEIANDMLFINKFMGGSNKDALIKTGDEFGDESFAIIPFTQWYRSGGFKPSLEQ